MRGNINSKSYRITINQQEYPHQPQTSPTKVRLKSLQKLNLIPISQYDSNDFIF